MAFSSKGRSAPRGSLNPTTLATLQAVVEKHCMGLEKSKIGVNATWDGGSDPTAVKSGDFVEIQVTYPFQFVAAGLLVEGGNTIQMSSTTRIVAAN